MGSFADIDEQLADAPVEVVALLAKVEDLAASQTPAPAPFEQLSAEVRTSVLEMGRGPLSVRSILQLHRVLLHGTEASRAGLPADARRGLQLTELVARYELAVSQRRHPPLLLACALVLDFAAIEPFEAGNEHAASLLLLRELRRQGYEVPWRNVLRASPFGWTQSDDRMWPWVAHVLQEIVEHLEEQR